MFSSSIKKINLHIYVTLLGLIYMVILLLNVLFMRYFDIFVEIKLNRAHLTFCQLSQVFASLVKIDYIHFIVIFYLQYLQFKL